MVDINSDSPRQKEVTQRINFINSYICGILGTEKLEDLNIEAFERINEKTVMENVLKYLLEFEYDQITGTDFCNLNTNRFESPFLNLLKALLNNSDVKTFGPLYGNFIKDKINELCFIADANVLLQVAYLRQNKEMVVKILKQKNIDVNQLKIRARKNRKFVRITAYKGYFELLKIMCDGNDFKIVIQNKVGNDVSIFSECLIGNNNCDDECLQVSSICERKYDECIMLLINHKDFTDLSNPMKEAVKHDCKTAILGLFQKFGLKSEYVQELDKSRLLMLLNSCVTEEKTIDINCEFMKDDAEGIMSLVSIISNRETKELITNPVLSTLINFKVERFSTIFRLNLILFVLTFIGPIAWGLHTDTKSLFFLGATALLFREILQFCFCYKKLKYFSGKFKFLSKLKSFYVARGNIIESLLVLTTIFCGITEKSNDLIYRMFLIVTILLTTVEFSLLLTAVAPPLAIYMFMLQKVIKTFLKTSILIILYILAFGICFRVVFYRPDNEMNDYESFNNWSTTFLRLTVMMAGEYDASSLNFNSELMSKLFVFGFVLSAILFYNFINALAIADVQKLKEKAEFHDLELKIKTLERHNFMRPIFKRLLPDSYKITKQSIDSDRKITYFIDGDIQTKINRVSKKTYNRFKHILREKDLFQKQEDIEKTQILLKKIYDESFAEFEKRFDEKYKKDMKEFLKSIRKKATDKLQSDNVCEK